MTGELERCVRDPGYTPPVRAVDELLGELARAPEEVTERLERALARAGLAAARAARAHLRASDWGPAAKLRLLGVIARVAGETRSAELIEPLIEALTDAEPRSQRLAARALGNLGDARAEAPLITQLGRAALPEQRAIVEALGKVGGDASRAALSSLPRADAELARRIERATVLLARRASRRDASAIETQATLDQATRVALLCRSGLAAVLAEETRSLGATIQSPSRVEVLYSGALQTLYEARTLTEVALVVPTEAALAHPAERIARALTHEAVLAPVRRWSRGAPRFRLAWSDGAHHRALTWQVAQTLHGKGAPFLNDPRSATWVVRADPEGSEVLLIPRVQPDPRFVYRVQDVPAASHPTLAAALVRVARARPHEVVWDPFVGSGLELIERAKLGPYRRLLGTDVDARALEAARANIAAAGVRDVELVEADARTFVPPRGNVDVILTNPPMGRRVARDGTVALLLDAIVEHAARVLGPEGRLIWLSPLADRTARTAMRAGLRVERRAEVDMGGFSAELQILTKPVAKR